MEARGHTSDIFRLGHMRLIGAGDSEQPNHREGRAFALCLYRGMGRA